MLLNTKIPFSYIIKKIKIELLFVIIIATIVKILSTHYRDIIPDMPIAIPAFIGTAISIILSFKLNQSYDRWWEARKIWGAIVNDSRSLVLLLQSFLPDNRKNEIKEITYRQIAWCYSLSQSLRAEDPLQNTDEFLSKTEKEYLKKHHNKPLAILQLNTLHIKDLKNLNEISEFNHVQLTNILTRFSDSMGMAERINNTVFPMTYKMLLHFMIYIFVITLSLALGEIDSIYELPLLIIVSAAFLLLEKTATHMQDPFENRPSDIPMTTITKTIETNLKQLIHEYDSIPKTTPIKTFYSL